MGNQKQPRGYHPAPPPLLAVIYLAFTLTATSVMAQEGSFTIGFMWEALSRGGFILGYSFTDDVSLELHMGGVTHTKTRGATFKIRPSSDDRSHYFLVGAAKVSGDARVTDRAAYGLNFGYGYEFPNDDDRRWRFPLEIGLGPALIKEDSRTRWLLTKEREGKEERAKEDAGIEPLPPEPWGFFFFGGGVQWYSKTFDDDGS